VAVTATTTFENGGDMQRWPLHTKLRICI